MTSERRFAIEILPDLGYRELVRRFTHAESLGFDIATTADQFVDWKNPDQPWFDVWVLLAGVAEATESIRLAPYVAQIPMRDPATFARQVQTVDHISGGRVEAGLGIGLTVDPGYQMMGIPNWDNPERADRFGEYLEIVGALLLDNEATFTGDFYRVDGARIHASVQAGGPPITIAAMGPRMLRYAAKYARTWNSMSFEPSFETQRVDAAARLERMQEYCAAIGRDPASLRHSFLVFDPDSRASGGHLAYYESPERFRDIVEPMIEMGYDEVGMYYPIDSQRDMFERIATEVVPTLR